MRNLGGISIHIRGAEKVRMHGQQFERMFYKAVETALNIEGQRVMHRAKELTPVATGKLRQSGIAHPAVRVASSVSVFLEFTAPHAAAVHESPRSGKTKGFSPSGKAYPQGSYATQGQWKFLETARNEAAVGLVQRVGVNMRAMLPLKPR